MKTASINPVIRFYLLLAFWVAALNCSTATEQDTLPSIKEGDIIEFYQCTVKPEVLLGVDPVYPDSARAAGIEGLVVLRGLVGIDSLVEVIVEIKSVPALDQAAIDALRQYRFKPAEYHGIRVRVWMTVPFIFKL
jgi:protein TonB